MLVRVVLRLILCAVLYLPHILPDPPKLPPIPPLLGMIVPAGLGILTLLLAKQFPFLP